MWGKNSSQVIRDDENARFFQFEPYAVPLGVWKALKVSCFPLEYHLTYSSLTYMYVSFQA